MEVHIWPIDKLIFYARNPRKNDAAVDRMCGSIREFGFKIPCLVRSDGEVIDGHLRLKAARKLGITDIPVILCDEWTPAQVKAFRLMVNRSATWADWDEELLALELQDLQIGLRSRSDGFDPKEIDDLLLNDTPDEDDAPPLPESPGYAARRSVALWSHRVLCGDATDPDVVSRLLGERKPLLMVTDPPYGIELDSEWRDRAGLNGCGPAEPSYLKKRTTGHREISISGELAPMEGGAAGGGTSNLLARTTCNIAFWRTYPMQCGEIWKSRCSWSTPDCVAMKRLNRNLIFCATLERSKTALGVVSQSQLRAQAEQMLAHRWLRLTHFSDKADRRSRGSGHAQC